MLFESQLLDFFRWLPSEKLKRRKREVRGIMTQKARVLNEEDRKEHSRKICERLQELEAFQEAESVLFYYPVNHEVDVRPILEEMRDTKVLLLPVAHRRFLEMRRYTGRVHLHRGRFGIPEPSGVIYTGKPSMIIVPGVAFDADCNRMGHGGGYYDRFLRQYSHIPVVALAYDFQMVKKVPAGSHDQKVDMILTPTTTYYNAKGYFAHS